MYFFLRHIFVAVTGLIFFLPWSINAIKTDVFRYYIYKTDNFDIYYSAQELSSLLPFVRDMAEEIFTSETEFFNLNFNYRIPLFLFYGYKDFLQNTIVPVGEGTGGVTEAFKNRILVPFTGSKKVFQHVLMHEFIHEVQFNILYSGYWRTPLLLKSIFYPYWLMEGYAEYRARWFTKTKQEMLVRDMVLSDKLISITQLHNFAHLKPHMVLPAYEQSAKLTEFIVTEYGEQKLSELLRVYRERFDGNSVLYSVCKITIDDLDKKFKEEMKTHYEYELKRLSMTDLDIKQRITRSDIYPVHNYSPCRYKEFLIYLSDINGKKNFYKTHLFSNKKPEILIPKRILTSNVDVIDTERVSVSDTGILCFTGLKNNRSYIYFFDLKNKRLKKYRVKDVDFLTSAYISSNGEYVAFTGVKNAINDVYILDLKTFSVTKLTDDEHFESQVTIFNDKIAYSKELPCVKKLPDDTELKTFQTDIFVYDLKSGSEIRVTETLSDESYPCFVTDDSLVYVSDYNEEYTHKLYGVNNLFFSKIDSKSMIQLTNVIGGVSQPCVDTDGNIFLCYYRNFDQHIYQYNLEELFSKEKLVFSTDIEKTQVSYIDKKPGVLEKKVRSIPYKTSFSTDLFIPFLYYSTYEGFAGLFYWKVSDMVGEHDIGIQAVAVGGRNVQYRIDYQYLKFRPGILFSVAGESQYLSYRERILRTYNETILGIVYPLSKISNVSIFFGYPYISYKYETENFSTEKNENIIYLGYTYSTIVGKYLEPYEGSRFRLGYQVSDRFIDGDYSYQIIMCDFVKYFHLGKEHSLITKCRLGKSIGRDKKYYFLGGPDGVRGVEKEEVVSETAGIFSLGYRIPVVYDVNYHMWYLFPDLFFKGFYIIPFIDTGFGVVSEIKNVSSFGINFKLYSFIFQAYPLSFNLTFARKFYPEVGPGVIYFTILGGI